MEFMEENRKIKKIRKKYKNLKRKKTNIRHKKLIKNRIKNN